MLNVQIIFKSTFFPFFLCLLASTFCNTSLAQPGLANEARATINSGDSEAWPDQCESYRSENQEEVAIDPTRVVQLPAKENDLSGFPVVAWRGVHVPIPDESYRELLVAYSSLYAIRNNNFQIIFTDIDLAQHFDAFRDINGFETYSNYENNLIHWLEAGWKILASDMECRPSSVSEDIVLVVHKLIADMAIASIDEDTLLYKINSPYEGLLLGDTLEDGKSRIQYIFQNPTEGKTELISINYYLKQSFGILQSMALFARSISSSETLATKYSPLVSAILNRNHDESVAAAELIGIEVLVRE